MKRAGLALCGWCVPLVPVALLNHERFGSYNPVSYGQCIWSHCALFESKDLHAGKLLAFFGPALAYFVVVGVALVMARQHRRALAAVVAVAVVALCIPSPFRVGVLGMLGTLYGYVVDTSKIDFGTPWSYYTAADGLGHMRGGRVIKSLLHSSPIWCCAALAGFGVSGQRGRALMVLAPFVGLCASLLLFARFQPPYRFGDPFVLLRYVVPACPFLAVLAAYALSRLTWRAWHFALALVLGLAGAAWLATRPDDAGLLGRVLVLRVTLGVGVASAAALAVTRPTSRPWLVRLTGGLAAIGVALSLAVSLGSDTAVLGGVQRSLDAYFAAFAARTPQRLAVVGYGPQSDHVLTLRAERDIAYIDLVESKSWDNFRVLIDLYSADGRPIYAVFPTDVDPPFTWPYAAWDVRATCIDVERGFWKIEPPEPGRRLTPEQIDGLRGHLHDEWEKRGRKAP